MTSHFAPSIQSTAIPADLLVEAARCWRGARDKGVPVQPCLFGLLSSYECGMLAPVLDSVMTLWEAALGRNLHIGQHDRLSDDEHVLLGLFDGTHAGTAGASRPADHSAELFDCALCSARIMMDRVMSESCSPIP